MDIKKWWKSRTLWVNAIAMAGIGVFHFTGVEVTVEEAGAALVTVNMFMRIITKSGLET